MDARTTEKARVLIVGLGGLGCPASQALALAGARRFTFIDGDRVEPSNLPRQLWHRAEDVGRRKVDSASERFRSAFPDAVVEARPERLTAANARALFDAHDLVIDGVDGVATKLLLSDAAVITGTPLVYGGVLRWSGQAMAIVRGGPCLRCLYETPPDADLPTCASAGVVNAVAGQVGATQALLAREALSGRGGRLVLVDGRSLTARSVTVRKNPDCICAEPSRLELRDEEALRCAI